jgi:tetratricopeptide (TPR) repeat protein
LALAAVVALREAGAQREAHELDLALAQRIAGKRGGVDQTPSPIDFFISYANADAPWAEWIAWQLEEAGYTTTIQAWDFRPGANFVLEMQKAATKSARTMAVLSPRYLSSAYAAPEWAAAVALDPTGDDRTLIPVRVAPCELTGLLRQIVYVDLVGLDEEAARDRLLQGLAQVRAKPSKPPTFPREDRSALRSTVNKPVFPETLPALWNVPYERNVFFTGREEVLQQLRNALSKDSAAALSQTQAISGLGGIGKTQTAVEYAYRHRDDYKAVFWVRADTELGLRTGFVDIARLLNLPEKDAQDQDEAVRAVKQWLEAQDEWLLVLDNADDLRLARDFLPPGRKGHTLLTTRAHAVGAMDRIEIARMEPDEGALFLLRRAKLIADDAPLTAASAADQATAREISIELDGLPLALDQAGAFIEEMPSSPAEYLKLYRQQGAKLRAERGGLATDHPSVTVTFSLAFNQVEARNKAAADLIRVCAFLAPDAIPEEIFTAGAAELGEHLRPVGSDSFEFTKAVHEAARFSLIGRNPENKSLDIHRLVQEVVKDEMDAATRRCWAERTVRAVNQAFPSPEYANWPLCDGLLPHAKVAATLVEDWNFEFQTAARLLNEAARYSQARAQYAQAQPLYTRALAIREKALGPDHPAVATSLNNLALLYHDQGQYAQAQPLYTRALAIREKALGPDHPAVATSLENYAALLRAIQRDTEAEKLEARAQAIRAKHAQQNKEVDSGK